MPPGAPSRGSAGRPAVGHDRALQASGQRRAALTEGPTSNDRDSHRCLEPNAGVRTPDLPPHRMISDGIRGRCDPSATRAPKPLAVPPGWVEDAGRAGARRCRRRRAGRGGDRRGFAIEHDRARSKVEARNHAPQCYPSSRNSPLSGAWFSSAARIVPPTALPSRVGSRKRNA